MEARLLKLSPLFFLRVKTACIMRNRLEKELGKPRTYYESTFDSCAISFSSRNKQSI